MTKLSSTLFCQLYPTVKIGSGQNLSKSVTFCNPLTVHAVAIYPDQCAIYGAQNKIQCISGATGHVKTLQQSLVPVISQCENRQLEHKKLFSDRLTVHAVAIYPDQCSIYGAKNKIHNISGVIGHVKTLQHSLVPVISHCENRQ